MYLILASKSPRRKEILMNAGYHIRICVSDADEVVSEINPEDKVLAIAKKKGEDVFSKFKNDHQAIIISADTIVVINDEILGKPKDKDDARRMINMLQGKTHYVYTAVYIRSVDSEESFIEKTEVNVSSMNEDEIEKYISSPEPYDKAGGYAIQGIFSQYITSINGDYYNVMGLPINKVKQVLNKYDLNNQLQCTVCGHTINENDAFCFNCGAKINLINKKKICSYCHKVNKNDSTYCEFCGTSLINSASYVYNNNECPICHHINEPGKEYCKACGTLLNINKETKKLIKIQEEKITKKDYSNVSLILGIISISLVFFCYGFVSMTLAILACVFGGISLARGYTGKSLAGTIMGGVVLFINIIIIVLIILEVSSILSSF